MNPKAILLDMDDTIISFDLAVDHKQCWRNACNKHLTEMDVGQIEHTINIIQEKARFYWSHPERHRIGRLDLEKARSNIIHDALQSLQVAELHRSAHIAVDFGFERDQSIAIFPGAIETIELLRNKGIKLALITNGSSKGQRRKIEQFNLAHYFDCIIIEEELGFGKPDHRVYQHALTQLNVTSAEAWMIGDNFKWEVAAPQELGIKGIWINHYGAEPPEAVIPHKTIVTLSDVNHLFN